MSYSPQSRFIINKLIEGQTISSGSVTIDELNSSTKKLLTLIVDNQDELSALSGGSRIDKLLTIFQDATQSDEISSAEQNEKETVESNKAEQTEVAEEASPKRYRLHQIECISFRGLAPTGEKVEFNFGGQSNLIYGPNGSGKSSLLGAVNWVFNGTFVNDFHDDSSQARIFKPQEDDKPLKKVADWNTVVTLPDSQISGTTKQECNVQITLIDAEGASLFLRRSLSDGLECSQDGENWEVCNNICDIGLHPLDLELSLNAPAELSRFTVEKACSVPQILAQLLGFQDIIDLGKLAGDIARNRTTYNKETDKGITTRWKELLEILKKTVGQFEDENLTPGFISSLGKNKTPDLEQIKHAGEQTKSQIATAQTELASLMGLNINDNLQLDTLSDDLLKALGELEKDTSNLFPVLSKISLKKIIPDDKECKQTDSQSLNKIKDRFTHFISSVSERIEKRYQWWLKERESQGRAGLLLHAAEFFKPEDNKCPVCERKIDNTDLRQELLEFKQADQELRDELNTYFNKLIAELDEIISPEMRSISVHSPQERLGQDWNALKVGRLSATLKPIFDNYDSGIEEIQSQIQVSEHPSIKLFSEETSTEFKNVAEDFQKAVKAANKALEILFWSASSYDALIFQLTQKITSNSPDNSGSLYNKLSAGRNAADGIKPLQRALQELQHTFSLRQELQKHQEKQELLSSWKTPMDSIKILKKYAENEIRIVFGEISQQTLEYWNILYPETSTGLKPCRLELGKKQGDGMQALLANEHCIVPEAFFANSGLQRAVALSLFFALLDKHPNGLDFVIMDDPVLSLDDDHREGWSGKILKPRMTSTQFIIATHQSHFYSNCRDDFSGNAVVEINTRSWPRSISFRPGNRLACAQKAMAEDWRTVPNQIRKFCEYSLRTLETYSRGPFYVNSNFSSTVTSYQALDPNDPLSSKSKDKISRLLLSNEVKRVLNPGSHGLSEADITEAMVRECLTLIGEFHELYKLELSRLEKEFVHSRRKNVINNPVKSFIQLPENSRWESNIEIGFFGSAAAKSERWEIEIAEDSAKMAILPGGAVLCTGTSLEPVARFGQWILLAEETREIRDGDLVAATCVNNDKLLRRITSNGDEWILKGINPIHPVPDICTSKSNVAPRVIAGVLFYPYKPSKDRSSSSISEWCPRDDFQVSELSKLAGVKVKESSLDPIARDGQHVLIDNSEAGSLNDVRNGDIAVIDSQISGIGRVVKRVYHHNGGCLLLSPNPVDPHPPLEIQAEQIYEARFWIVRGVLFDSIEFEL